MNQSPGPVVESLESLVEHSLVVSDGTGRLSLLEPVAQYARDLLAESGDLARATRAHAAHYLDLAEATSPSYRDAGQVAALTRIDLEHANLTAAAERALATGDVETPARMAWALWLYWWLRGHHEQGRRLAEAVLERSDGLPVEVHGRAALAAATMAFAMDDVDDAARWWDRALAHTADIPTVMSDSVAGTGLVALVAGDLPAARERFHAAILHAEVGGPEVEWTWALAHIWLGTVALLEGDPDEAVRLVEAGLGSARRRGDRLTSYIALYNLFQVELDRGDHAAASRHLQEGTRSSLETGDTSPPTPPASPRGSPSRSPRSSSSTPPR